MNENNNKNNETQKFAVGSGTGVISSIIYALIILINPLSRRLYSS